MLRVRLDNQENVPEQTSKVLQKRFIPRNLVINLQFQEGEYQLEQLGADGQIQKKDFLQAYQMNPNHIQNQRIENDNEIIVHPNPQSETKLGKFEIDESKSYYQRKLREQDGIIHYYAQPTENRGRFNLGNNADIMKDIKQFNSLNSHNHQNLFNETIQMLVCVTMYNESLELFLKTLQGIQSNLPGFNQIGISPERIVVVVIQDGIMKMDKSVVEYFDKEIDGEIREIFGEQYKNYELKERRKLIAEEQQFYKSYNPESLSKNNDIPPTIPKKVALFHQIQKNYFKPEDRGYDKYKDFKLTTFFLNKHLNGRKLSSHMWFFEGFCRFLRPKFVGLVDVGTKPEPSGLVYFYKALESDSKIGGVSGFMGLYNGKTVKKDKKKEEEKKEKEKKDNTSSVPIQIEPQQVELQIFNQRTMDEQVQKVQKVEKVEQLIDKRVEVVDEKKEYIKNFKRQQKENQKLINLYYQNKSQSSCCSISGCLASPIKLFLYILNVIKIFLVWLHNWVDPRNAQLFEYILAHMIDKNFESYFNFLHVLPGAWSAYRWKALSVSQKYKQDILQSRYLKIILNENAKEKDYREANMFLAEDRILCLGIFTQLKCSYTLKYIEDAEAYTDSIDDFEGLINQRRRWINSTYFALEYVLRNYQFHIENSSHPWYRKYIGIRFSMFMAWLNKINMYFLPGFFYFSLHLSCYQLFSHYIKDLNGIFQFIPGLLPFAYVILLIYMVLISLNYKISYKVNIKNAETFDMLSGIIGIYQFVMIGIVLWNVVSNYFLNIYDYQPSNLNNKIIQVMVWSMAGCNFGTIFIVILLHPSYWWRILKSFSSYLYYSGSYTHTFIVYSFCNVDDISWGTKGLNGNGGVKKYLDDKLKFVGQWIFLNAILVYVLISVNGIWGKEGWVLVALGLYGSLIMLAKFIFALFNILGYRLCQKRQINNSCKKTTDLNRKISQLVKERMTQFEAHLI